MTGVLAGIEIRALIGDHSALDPDGLLLNELSYEYAGEDSVDDDRIGGIFPKAASLRIFLFSVSLVSVHPFPSCSRTA